MMVEAYTTYSLWDGWLLRSPRHEFLGGSLVKPFVIQMQYSVLVTPIFQQTVTSKRTGEIMGTSEKIRQVEPTFCNGQGKAASSLWGPVGQIAWPSRGQSSSRATRVLGFEVGLDFGFELASTVKVNISSPCCLHDLSCTFPFFGVGDFCSVNSPSATPVLTQVYSRWIGLEISNKR